MLRISVLITATVFASLLVFSGDTPKSTDIAAGPCNPAVQTCW